MILDMDFQFSSIEKRWYKKLFVEIHDRLKSTLSRLKNIQEDSNAHGIIWFVDGKL